MDDWISGERAAEILGISRNAVLLSLQDPERRADQWGAEGEGWRLKPLVRRKIYQVSQRRTQQIAEGLQPRLQNPEE
jgi:hypothetical protein